MLDRRRFLTTATTAAIAAAWLPGRRSAALAGEAASGTWRIFEVVTRVDLKRDAGPAQLWLPVIQSDGEYQKAEPPVWQTNSNEIELRRDSESGAEILYAGWKGDGERTLTATQRVATRARIPESGSAASASELERALRGTASTPVDGIVRTTAMKIVEGRDRPADRARAVYDWVIDNTFRDANVAGCGVGNARDMLESGYFGGKCADISNLFVALARAAGLPAREVFGIRVADSADFKSLGRAGDITKAQHCRAEVYLEGQGWLAVDPADVRKVVLEENLPLDNPAVRAFREKAYGNWEMNWVGYNTARDFVLPGGDLQQGFLMYPAGVTAGGELDCFNPKTFAYSISSREIAA